MNEITAKNVNTLGAFCGIRDIEELTYNCLKEKYGLEQVDVAVLFGGSIIAGADVFASAIRNNFAKKYVIVGGAGHTTDTLRTYVREKNQEIETKDKTEAEIFAELLHNKYGICVDYLEKKSTNCGNNITNLLQLLEQEQITHHSVLLCQDATMQHRMDATLRKYVPKDVEIINYATYQVKVRYQAGKLCFEQEIDGMWNMDRYINLLMGEIPRLRDDQNGYGPNGKDYIAHVDIPKEVMIAYEQLVQDIGIMTREANPTFASDAPKKL